MNALLCLVKQTFLVEYIFSNDETLNLKLRQSIMFKQKFYFVWYDESGYMSVFRQPRIQTGQYLDKYCFNQSELRQRRN